MCRCVKLLTQDTVFGHAPPVPSLPPGSPEGKTSPTKSCVVTISSWLSESCSQTPLRRVPVPHQRFGRGRRHLGCSPTKMRGQDSECDSQLCEDTTASFPCLIPRAWPWSHRRGPLAIGRQPRGPRVHLRCASRHRTLLLLLMSLNRIKRPGVNQQNKLISQCERQAMSRAPTETPVLLGPGVTRSPVAPLLLFPPGYGERSLVLASSSCRP